MVMSFWRLAIPHEPRAAYDYSDRAKTTWRADHRPYLCELTFHKVIVLLGSIKKPILT
jgi:hypothetical protein